MERLNSAYRPTVNPRMRNVSIYEMGAILFIALFNEDQQAGHDVTRTGVGVYAMFFQYQHQAGLTCILTNGSIFTKHPNIYLYCHT